MSKLEELKQKEEQALAGGGAEKIEAQHKSGKKTARERINMLFDEASFVELDKFLEKTYATPGYTAATAPGEGVVCGYGTIDNRPVFAFAQDYTVLAGSLSSGQAEKILRTIDNAVKNGVPVIGILDSDGARVSEGIAAINSYSAIIKKLNDISGVIPSVTIVAGNCIGTAAYIAATTDFCFTINDISTLALHGPQVYASTLGNEIDVKVAFNAKTHNELTGVSQFLTQNEDDCYTQVKKLLSFLPSNNLEDSPYVMSPDDLNRKIEAGENVVYDPKNVITQLADNHDVLEYQAWYSPEMITMFGRLNGYAVGFIANGADSLISGHAARKAARFISILDAYNIPVVTLTNCSGTTVEKEKPMMISNLARLMEAYSESGVPKLNVITGKAIGDGFAVMCPKAAGADLVYAWPEAEITALPPETGAIIMYEGEIEKSPDPIAAKQAMIDKYKEEYANAWEAAVQGVVDDIIDPANTRQLLIAALEMFITKRDNSALPKKHNILPL